MIASATILAVATALGGEAADTPSASGRSTKGNLRLIVGPDLRAPVQDALTTSNARSRAPVQFPAVVNTPAETINDISVHSRYRQNDRARAARTRQPVVQLAQGVNYQQPPVAQTPAVQTPDAALPTAAAPPSAAPPPPAAELQWPGGFPAMRFEELPPPAPPTRAHIPLAGPELAERVQIKQDGGRLTVVVRDVPLNQVLMALGEEQGLNIVVADNVTTPVSVALENVELADVLDALTSISGYTWAQHHNIIHVTSATSSSRLAPHIQQRQLMVFPLDYVTATDVDVAVKGLLSPIGQSFITQRSTTDNRRTQEVLVVEDTPAFLNRIAEYVEQADQPPRQVMIQAHVMAVSLKGDDRHGVNWEYLFNPHGRNFSLQAQGFAIPAAPQAFFFNVDGTDLDSLVECLKSQTDSKTLASPKVLVLNNQEARLQVGRQLGFRVTTTTETSTLESVDFLDVGVVLRVTPRITRDGQIVMYVKPEVSSGLVNPDTGLPEEETTEVETNVLLPDGRGMVIGGLIQEKNIDSQSKLPYLGDIWLIGKLFQRKTLNRERTEIIITLLPRIVPAEIPCDSPHEVEVQHAMAPVFRGPLIPADRPWEPALLDAMTNPLTRKDLPNLCPYCHSQQCQCESPASQPVSGYQYYRIPAERGRTLLPIGAGATATVSDLGAAPKSASALRDSARPTTEARRSRRSWARR
jgi:hypothetical protein